MSKQKGLTYHGYIPPCGIFCGGCPNYIREKNKCCGAAIKCDQRKCGIYKCCVEKKKLRFCFECKTFSCSKFKKFAETWLKYGQDLIENQKIIEAFGEEQFVNYFNDKKNEDIENNRK
jgi:hypothetical protein